LYSSNRKDAPENNFLRLSLRDPSNKKSPVGAKVKLFNDGVVQYYENTIYRGFLSSVENIIHFGLGTSESVDSLVIQWSDGNTQKLTNPEINKLIAVEYIPTPSARLASFSEAPFAPFFKDQTGELGIAFKHEEDDKIDFNLQRTLPHKFTQSGPGLAVGDVNNDGMEDFIIGGSTGYRFTVFVQKADGSFRSNKKVFKDVNKSEEDEGLLLFDADGDRDTDLYIVSGSMEHLQTDNPYQDRLFLNDGKGKFTLAADALPDTKASGSCVRAADFDSDGDLDLFVGGRLIPGQYPASPESYLLRNDGGKFTDVTEDLCVALKNSGMVTDAIWTDYNGDSKVDLMVVGEFTPIMFYENTGKGFSRISTPLDGQRGWWNSITAGDYDLDGDVDYVVGNLGLNNCFDASQEFPMKVFAKDFDGNNSMDAIVACYMRESMTSDVKKLFPVHFWDELNTQSPKFRNKYSRYRQYGKATMDDLLDEADRKDALALEANQMASVFIENLGKNNFRMTVLSPLAQVAPVNGMITDDVNGDGYPDVIMVGNDYGNEVFVGRYDAFNGLILMNDGKGKFAPMTSAGTGFYVPGDAKSLVKVKGKNADLFIASQNKDSLKVFTKNNISGSRKFLPEPLDVKAELAFSDGKTQTVEFYYGSGYLSQSSRALTIPQGVRDITVYDSRGASRSVDPSNPSNLP
jgi:hypothetical protein